MNPCVCPSCKSTDVVGLGTLPKGRVFAGTTIEPPLPSNQLFRCSGCHLKFRYPLLEPSQYDKLYNNGKTTVWTHDTLRNDFRLIQNYARTHLRKDSKILDFGCYAGDLLTLLDDKPYQRFGVEINREAAKQAHTKTGAAIFPSLDAIPSDQRFDLIVAIDVVEHLPDPLDLIRSLLGRLENSGQLVITTGDADNWLWNVAGANWWYCSIPEHVAFISEEWLHRREREVGEPWEIIECRRFVYQAISLPKRAIAAARALLFAIFGDPYLELLGRVKRVLGRGGAPHPGGVGLLSDHLFVVLRTRRRSEPVR